MGTFSDDVAQAFHDIAGALYSATDTSDSLQQLADLAPKTFDSCRWAGIALVREGEVETAAASHDIVRELDALQDDAGSGPVLTALVHASNVVISDVSADDRWPGFSTSAGALGVRGVMAHRILVSGETLGALVLYADEPDAFDGIDEDACTIFAAYAGVALGCSAIVKREGRQLEELRRALASRDTIGQAKGIMIERLRLTPDEAFERLRVASMDRNIKLRDLADEVVRTGEVPVLPTGDTGRT
jgi:GAF domain-containing protein